MAEHIQGKGIDLFALCFCALIDRYVVFEQLADETARVNQVWGPFSSYERAAKFCKHMDGTKQDSDIWYGIRVLQKTQIHPM